MNNILKLFCSQALISAWESDQRVKALKIAIQVCTTKPATHTLETWANYTNIP